jgi:dihydrofolate reductase
MSWIIPHAISDQARDILTRLTNGTTAVLGRRNAEGFRGFWVPVGQDDNADPRDRAYGQWIEKVEKIIFSTTQTETDWNNARIVNDDPVKIIKELRAQPGGDIVVNNSLSLIRALLAADELDRLIVTLCPELSGGGMRMFQDEFPATSWALNDVTPTDSGAVVLIYNRRRDAA